jgi:hypothetical protein
MTQNEQIKAKIAALSLKTIENGASSAEAQAAREMILRLKEKLEPPKPNNQSIQNSETSNHIELYRKYQNEGTLHLHITEIDWDNIAKLKLDDYEYMLYLGNTHSIWERYQKSKGGLVEITKPYYITLDTYRKECFKSFSRHMKNKR